MDEFNDIQNLGKAFHWEVSKERAQKLNRLLDSSDPVEKEEGRVLALEERKKDALKVFYTYGMAWGDNPGKVTFKEFINKKIRSWNIKSWNDMLDDTSHR
jgi:hypothetical protein